MKAIAFIVCLLSVLLLSSCQKETPASTPTKTTTTNSTKSHKCLAPTKKGQPCQRLTTSKVCWQHD